MRKGVTFNVPNLPFSQAQRNEIFSETSSRVSFLLEGIDQIGPLGTHARNSGLRCSHPWALFSYNEVVEGLYPKTKMCMTKSQLMPLSCSLGTNTSQVCGNIGSQNQGSNCAEVGTDSMEPFGIGNNHFSSTTMLNSGCKGSPGKIY